MRPGRLWGMGTFRSACALALGLIASGCASTSDSGPMDPLEPVNRFFFDMNQKLDRNAALPAATLYRDTVPQPARTTLHNVLDNLGGPVTFANVFLLFVFVFVVFVVVCFVVFF